MHLLPQRTVLQQAVTGDQISIDWPKPSPPKSKMAISGLQSGSYAQRRHHQPNRRTAFANLRKNTQALRQTNAPHQPLSANRFGWELRKYSRLLGPFQQDPQAVQ